MYRIIEYQAGDGKWYELEVWDLIDPMNPANNQKLDFESHEITNVFDNPLNKNNENNSGEQ
jgi:hypothetical protein